MESLRGRSRIGTNHGALVRGGGRVGSGAGASGRKVCSLPGGSGGCLAPPSCFPAFLLPALPRCLSTGLSSPGWRPAVPAQLLRPLPSSLLALLWFPQTLTWLSHAGGHDHYRIHPNPQSAPTRGVAPPTRAPRRPLSHQSHPTRVHWQVYPFAELTGPPPSGKLPHLSVEPLPSSTTVQRCLSSHGSLLHHSSNNARALFSNASAWSGKC